MSKAIWFSRHGATPSQQVQIENEGYEIVPAPQIAELATLNLSTWEQVVFVVQAVKAFCDKNDIKAIYGVFPTPLQNFVTNDAVSEWKDHFANGEERSLVSCYSAWNIMRSTEGGKPTFEHKEWIWIGCLDVTDYILCHDKLDPDVIRAFIDRVRSGQ